MQLQFWSFSDSSSHKVFLRGREGTLRVVFWEGDATKYFSVKKRTFQWKGGGNSVNGGFGKDFYRKGNSVKRSARFSEPPDSENWKVAVLIPLPENRLLHSILSVSSKRCFRKRRRQCVRNASEMRQNGSCFIGKRGTSKMRQKSVKIASKCVKNPRGGAEHLWGRTPFGRYRF